MFRNHLKIALRSLKKQKFYALLNILGLAVGIACCLLITLFIQDELSYDKHFPDADRLHRVLIDIKFGEMDGKMSQTPAPLAKTLVDRFPEVEQAGRFRSWGDRLVRRDTTMDNIKEEHVIWADPEVFDLFSMPTLAGDPIEAFRAPATLVISRRIAEKYFPDTDPIGKTLILDNDREKPFQVVAVVEDLPENTHFRYNIFLSMASLEESKEPMWLSHNFHTYFRMHPGGNVEELEKKFPEMLQSLAGPQLQQFLGITIAQFEDQGNHLGYFIQPLSRIYLHSSDISLYENLRTGDIAYVYIFGIIAVFILLIACINFMNLATARSAMRAREVGVRKVLGSFRRQLVWQFLTESILLSAISIVFAVILAEMFLPLFNALSGKSLSIPLASPGFLLLLALATLGVGLLAGIYPAFFLSRFQPVEVLKGRLLTRAGSGWLRSLLVVFQFAASIVLIIGTMVVYQQLQYVQNKKLGFSKDQVLVLKDTYVLRNQAQAFKQDLLRMPAVKKATVSSFLPVSSTSRNNNAFWPTGVKTQDKTIILQNWTVDHDYVTTMEMEVVEGRDFSLDFPTDSQAVILNESAVRQFGLGDEPLGKKISTLDDIDVETGTQTVADYTVVGVIKDFHFESMKENISALGLFLGDSKGSISCRVETADLPTTLAAIEEKWKSFASGQPLSYAFMDQEFEKMYGNEQRQGKIFAAFAFLAIFVACLGLLGLASFTAERRMKEIGIRKVLGATVGHIVLMLSREFALLIAIAFVIASIGGGIMMNRWLSDFAYRIDLSPGLFIGAGLLAMAVALLTVSYQSVRAALSDPVRSLRNE